jgi:hypothetical protein
MCLNITQFIDVCHSNEIAVIITSMILLPQTLIQIIAAGGGITINLEKQMLLPETMIQAAAAASHSGAKVTFQLGKVILLPQTMIQVAAAGRGNVIFEI